MSSDRTPRSAPIHVLGALALELKGDASVGRTGLPQGESGALAVKIARDLAGFAAEAAGLELVSVGAHYDPVELLRPGWPLHTELIELAARAPRDGSGTGRIIAFGSHEQRLPGNLTPSPDYAGGPLRLVPFALGGKADTAARVGDAFETALLERGMAGAGTALAAQEAFGVQVEHARYLTVHDLTAMMAMQYEHAGLGPLWPVLETALLQPDGEEWLDAPPEPLLHYADREARIALFSPAAWHERYAPASPCDTPECRDQLNRRYQHFEARLRQITAVLSAHAVPVTFVHCDQSDDARAAL